MSKLKEKSSFNLAAAEILIEKNLYAPSIHCSYYSCLQLMKYSLNNTLHISYEQLKINIDSAKKAKTFNTHTYIIHEIATAIHSKSKPDYTIFKRKIDDLKKFRERSDYDNIEIDYDKSNQAYQIADDVVRMIKKNFK